MVTTPPPRSRAFILGLDGIPWELIEKWTDDGELPNFQRVRSEGASGPLDSTTPPETALAWPSIATGVWPDKHGISGFQALEPNYSHRMNTSHNIRRPELWDIVSPSVVGNVPMTYPAEGTDATVVAGMLTPERDGAFTNPPELADEIEDAIPDYEIGLSWQEYHGREETFRQDLRDLVSARRELMDLLLRRDDWRLFFFVYTAPDRLQHLVWDETVLLDHYRTLDDILGDAMETAEREDATLYVVSDHGFEPITRLVYLNGLLEREGYLVPRADNGTRRLLARLGIDKDRLLGLLDLGGIDDQTLVKYLPRFALDAVAVRVPGEHGLYDLDYDRTIAFAHGPGNVYVNDTDRFAAGEVEPDDVERIKSQLIELFESVTDPDTGQNPLRVRDGATIYPSDDLTPDLVVRGQTGYAMRTSLSDRAFTDAKTKAGNHHREGIFLAWGPAVAAESAPEDASVVDIAPTVLHGLGEPIPSGTDGRVLAEIFDPDSEPGRRAPTTTEYATTTGTDTVDEDFSEVENRLRGLGYME